MLDFGGGVGGLSVFMARYGLRCDYLDVPGKTFDFAKWRFRKRNLEVVLYTDINSLLNLAYEGVVAYDVLEHLFDVEETIRKIGCALKNKSYFISKSSFGEEGVHLKVKKGSTPFLLD